MIPFGQADMILSDEEVAQYAGIIDLIPGVANVIQQLVPVMQEQAVRAGVKGLIWEKEILT